MLKVLKVPYKHKQEFYSIKNSANYLLHCLTIAIQHLLKIMITIHLKVQLSTFSHSITVLQKMRT